MACPAPRLVAIALLALAGCASFQARPLPAAPDLAASLAALQRTLPDGRVLRVDAPLSLDDVAALAVLNDPDLRAARAQHQVGQAVLLAAGTPPDPSITGGFAALTGGPGSIPSLNAALSEDLGALITGPADRRAARAGLRQIDEGILWQEWQMAARAEQLAITLEADEAALASLRQDAARLGQVNSAIAAQIRQDNLTSNDGLTALTALAGVQTSLDAAAQTQAQDVNALDALLGLQPGIAIPLAPPAFTPPAPGAVQAALASLADRRPDLLALRAGYEQADQQLRAAILTQFLPLNLGVAGGRDTSDVQSIGPQATLTLPLFNRNRPAIAAARATRAALHAQYQAALDNAAAAAAALPAQIAMLQAQDAAAQAQAVQAQAMAAQAGQLGAGQLAAPALAGLQALAGERARNAIQRRAQLQTAELSLATLLGFGLPPLVLEAPP